jgi:hypothetical protein
MAVINSPFESQYGFKGPGFSVDNLGNITAKSIITSDVAEESQLVDFTVTEENNAFLIQGYAGVNPTISIARAKSYKFSITLPLLGFTIYSELPDTKYNTGLVYQDSATGEDAQGKLTGTLTFNVSLNTPDVLYYGNADGNVYGTINVVDPIGQFSTVDVNSIINSTSSTTGAVTIAGGVGIEKDLHVGGELNLSGLGIPRLSSLTNLELNASNKIILQVNDIKLGELNSNGLSITINNSTINNTAIGETSPSTAAFTSATVATLPTVDASITNRQYVDSTALSLAIAFGL